MSRKKKQKAQGAEAFFDWYEAHWGERWASLYEALQAPVSHVAWWNPWSTNQPHDVLPADATPSERTPGCWEAATFPPPPLDEQGHRAYYLLDGASVLAAQALASQPGERTLDMCAAPGGKSLLLSAQMQPGEQLTSNDLSSNRLRRLQQVFEQYIPAPKRTQLQLTHHDASRWCLYQKEAFDRVLLDVPCSSERHLLHHPKELDKWSPSRSKSLAHRQYAILASALEVVTVGGTLLYSTCSISPLECDQVIAKLHKKRKGRFAPVPYDLTPSPSTQSEWGHWLLPDEGGWGPIYMSLLQRLS